MTNLIFLNREQCGRCKFILPKLQKWAKDKDISIVERNVDSELTRKDAYVAQNSGQKMLPIIYFDGEQEAFLVDPTTNDYDKYYDEFKKRETNISK